MTASTAKPQRWVGNRLPRREDPRMLRGAGRFVDDIADPHAYHATFVRSPIAAGRIASIDASEALAMPGVHAVLTAADLGYPQLTAALERAEFVATQMPLLAYDRVRYASEPVAIVVAESRYLAEDAAEAVLCEFDETQAVLSIRDVTDGGRALHDEAPDGVLVDLQMFSDDLLGEALDRAPVVLEETISSGRVMAAPMEARACHAQPDARDDQLVLHVSTQVPHQVRSGVAQALGLPERRVRVIAPDVGGGFGLKCVVGREEVVVAAVAEQLGHSVRWSEDRQENLTAAFHGREQEYLVRAGFDSDGTLIGVDADIRCNIGAYSVYPFSCGVEPLMAATELPGVYKVGRYAARARGVATNKPPTAPYRGVSRPQIVLVMERLMDKAAKQLDIDRVEIRRRNTIHADEFPYTGPNGITYEPGSYVESLDRLVDEIGKAGWWERRAATADGVLRGIGIANFSERTAYGTPTMGMRKMQMTPGFEVSHVRMDPTGEVTVTSGTCGHGQGHETTFAQIVADRLGISPDRVKLRQGDTDLVSFGWGTFGSRSLVIGGGSAAVAARRLADKIRKVAGELLEADPADIDLVDGHAEVRGAPDAHVSIEQIAATVHFRAHELREHDEQLLEARGAADPPGMFSNAAHAALVEVDPGTGDARVVDYIVVEDCGVVINPTIVDGQVRGGVAQGIASALYEELVYSPEGQPLAGTFMDYLVPTASEIPPIAVHHLETPCDQTETGAKGMGEGGTIGAPATVVSALNDALRAYGADIDHVPVRPADLLTLFKEHRLHTPREAS
ncbi:xanthine dehydrogenase family protein molybdopterin-binding subunit [Solicola gregarius]|uniref:Xanthine dehydrogenase family protein molybdopterin-binding subunit n=1 Tax=Solicola gregarius TaxID=2908642 RepID=A0AA46TMU5_9ACTN|nr:xanthine dehydrogenase family protein molybdopterin-binding subunit [Solicola gregarius]UYM07283.1 xanthine dehydrogenase family protein molybdopterin-binding subunit [Solicola gregarius]